EAIDLNAMVPTPLKSVDLTIGTLIDASQVSGGGTWVMPTVVGDRVFVNDGETISCFDRFTLSERWRWTPPGDVMERRQTQAMVGRRARNLEDSSSVAVAGDVVVATTGLAFQGGREGDPRTHALDRWTGRHLWSVSVEHMDARLEYGVVSGPALIHEGTVVLSVRKFVQSRRLNGTFLVGLDLHTGAPRWIRLIGSSGALPHRGSGRIADAGVIHRGIVYRSDESGVIAAVEATTGRPVWVRRSRSLALYSPDSTDPWSSQVPLVRDESLIVIAPDREEVLRLDLATGDVTRRMPAHRLGNPRYLLELGDRLIAVSSRLVTSCPIDGLSPDAPVSIVQQFDDQRDGVV
ncbi:MAG: PQQ-binding-like beta-propeller repeat protein, partial [Phycisphaerales bacterium]|nr:PQQ-binding-like beta-propeller repeat protein [Phycisphaerales bacterium]